MMVWTKWDDVFRSWRAIIPFWYNVCPVDHAIISTNETRGSVDLFCSLTFTTSRDHSGFLGFPNYFCVSRKLGLCASLRAKNSFILGRTLSSSRRGAAVKAGNRDGFNFYPGSGEICALPATAHPTRRFLEAGNAY